MDEAPPETPNPQQVQTAIEKDFELSKQAQKGQMAKLHEAFLVEEVLPFLQILALAFRQKSQCF